MGGEEDKKENECECNKKNALCSRRVSSMARWPTKQSAEDDVVYELRLF